MSEAVRVIGRPSLSRRAPFEGTTIAIPVRTQLVDRGADVAEVAAAATAGIAAGDDVVCISETAVAIAQGRAILAETIRPGRLAYVLSRRANTMATVSQPESLQLVIDEAGAWKVFVAAVAHLFDRLLRRRGTFYRILGERIATIDGYSGTLPPFERTIVLGPADPGGTAARIAQRCGAGVAIVDANDFGTVKVLGASPGVDCERVVTGLRDNPHGNGDEQTPIVVLKRRAA